MRCLEQTVHARGGVTVPGGFQWMGECGTHVGGHGLGGHRHGLMVGVEDVSGFSNLSSSIKERIFSLVWIFEENKAALSDRAVLGFCGNMCTFTGFSRLAFGSKFTVSKSSWWAQLMIASHFKHVKHYSHSVSALYVCFEFICFCFFFPTSVDLLLEFYWSSKQFMFLDFFSLLQQICAFFKFLWCLSHAWSGSATFLPFFLRAHSAQWQSVTSCFTAS